MSELPKCKSCGMIGSDGLGAKISGWINIKLQGWVLNEDFWLCDKCTAGGYVLKLNSPPKKYEQLFPITVDEVE